MLHNFAFKKRLHHLCAAAIAIFSYLLSGDECKAVIKTPESKSPAITPSNGQHQTAGMFCPMSRKDVYKRQGDCGITGGCGYCCHRWYARIVWKYNGFAEQYRRRHRRSVPAWCSSGKWRDDPVPVSYTHLMTMWCTVNTMKWCTYYSIQECEYRNFVD